MGCAASTPNASKKQFSTTRACGPPLLALSPAAQVGSPVMSTAEEQCVPDVERAVHVGFDLVAAPAAEELDTHSPPRVVHRENISTPSERSLASSPMSPLLLGDESAMPPRAPFSDLLSVNGSLLWDRIDVAQPSNHRSAEPAENPIIVSLSRVSTCETLRRSNHNEPGDALLSK